MAQTLYHLKKYKIDDEIPQWKLCAAIWLVNLVINLMLHCSEEFCNALGLKLGNVNIVIVPFMKTVALGLGILI